MAKGEIFKTLPQWAKGVIAVAVVGGAAYIGYKIYKKISKIATPDDFDKEIKNISDDVKTLEKSGQKATLSNSQIAGLANSIQTALNGMTEDEAAVYRAFSSVKTDIDVLNLIKAYGVSRVGYYVWSYFTGTLPATLTHLFDKKEIKALNDILSRKGIKYTF